MNRPLRRRFLVLMVAGMSLLGVTWLLGREMRRGASYYFPTWQLGEFSEQRYGERFAELTNVSQSLPIVLQVMQQRPSKFGGKWEELREKLPAELNRLMPRYLGPNWAAAHWLAQHATEAEVAVNMVERWDQMCQELRTDWLTTIGPNQVSQRPEYLPLLRRLTGDPDPEIALTGAYLMAGYRPISEMDAVAVRNVMLAGGAQVSLRLHLLLAWQIGLQPRTSPALIEALQTWADSTNRTCAVAGALGLVMVDPVRYSPGDLLEPRWRKLPRNEARQVLEMARRPGFEQLMLSDWALDFFGKLLSAPSSRAPAATFENDPPKDSILWSYRLLGTNAVRFVPALVAQFPKEDLGRSAAMTFATVAGTDASLVPSVTPALTNAEAAGPLLLWLTQLGPRARSARTVVQRLATDEIRFLPGSETVRIAGLDPVLAKRFGLRVSETPKAGRKPMKAGFRLPSEVSVVAEEVCPWSLVGLWPGSGRGFSLPDLARLPAGDRSYLVSLPESNLAELAQRCLAAMDAVPAAEKPDSANRSANQ